MQEIYICTGVVSIDTDWHSIVPLLCKEEKRQVNSFAKILVLSLFCARKKQSNSFEFLQYSDAVEKSEALFMDLVTSYSTSEGDVTWASFKSIFIYGSFPLI